MIEIIPKSQLWNSMRKCNSCSENKAIIELEIKSPQSNHGIAIALCGDCIKTLQESLNSFVLEGEKE